MAEREIDFSREAPENFEVTVPGPESRYGNKNEILTAFRETDPGNIKTLGGISEALEHYSHEYGELIPPHTNIVELVQILRETGDSVNSAIPLEIDTPDSKPLFAIFKPISGEKHSENESRSIDVFAPNEEIAFEVSEHFGLDLVPPTTLRFLGDDNLGSIQLYLDPFRHGLYGHVFPEHDHGSQMRSNPDFQSMAVLDFLLLNPDRNKANFMVEASIAGKHTVDGVEQPRYEISQPLDAVRLFAIDHGCSFSAEALLRHHNTRVRGKLGGVPGPMRDMTVESKTHDIAFNASPTIETHPLSTPITLPTELKEKLEKGYESIDELENRILFIQRFGREDMTDQQQKLASRRVSLFRQRAEQLIEKGYFLSPYTANIERE